MNIIFFGNTNYSLIGAQIIHQHLPLSHIVTIPDRPNKKGTLTPSPLKTFGIENNIPILTVNKLDSATIEIISAMQPDFFVVEDYGLILPPKLLETPLYAPLNIHHSLLPKYRGPSPAPSALLAGETQTGVSIIHMTNTVDAGPIYAQQPYTIQATDTTDSLLTHLNQLGGDLVVQVINDIINGQAIATPQDEKQATLTHFMKKSDGFIDLDNPPSPTHLDRMIRAYYPWPTVWLRLAIAPKSANRKIIKFLPNNKMQMEGKKPVSYEDFMNGYPTLREEIKKLFQ
jgi:methionyl-tRNA formyltransferase